MHLSQFQDIKFICFRENYFRFEEFDHFSANFKSPSTEFSILQHLSENFQNRDLKLFLNIPRQFLNPWKCKGAKFPCHLSTAK